MYVPLFRVEEAIKNGKKEIKQINKEVKNEVDT